MKRAKARRPLVVIAWLSREVRTLRMTKKLTKWEYMAVEENISELISGFNGVDKIRFTQIPFPCVAQARAPAAPPLAAAARARTHDFPVGWRAGGRASGAAPRQTRAPPRGEAWPRMPCVYTL